MLHSAYLPALPHVAFVADRLIRSNKPLGHGDHRRQPSPRDNDRDGHLARTERDTAIAAARPLIGRVAQRPRALLQESNRHNTGPVDDRPNPTQVVADAILCRKASRVKCPQLRTGDAGVRRLRMAVKPAGAVIGDRGKRGAVFWRGGRQVRKLHPGAFLPHDIALNGIEGSLSRDRGPRQSTYFSGFRRFELS
jgi:hypothetical protein